MIYKRKNNNKTKFEAHTNVNCTTFLFILSSFKTVIIYFTYGNKCLYFI